MKECNQCNKLKPLSEYYKRSASPDGKQAKCKSCVKIINENFRTLKPKYQDEWYKKNWDKWLSYTAEWHKNNVCADDSRSAIYYIVNPENKIYVGSTQTLFSARQSAHKAQYQTRNRILPLLHKSFDIFGYDNHKWVILDMSGVDRETLRAIEYSMINHFNQIGLSLNVRLK